MHKVIEHINGRNGSQTLRSLRLKVLLSPIIVVFLIFDNRLSKLFDFNPR